MPRFTSKTLLLRLEEDVRELRQIAGQEFRHLSDARFLQAPTPAQWSVAQCLEHLNSYGLYYIPLIEKAIQTGEQHNLTAKDVFSSGWLGNYFAESMRPGADGAIRLKMKAVKNHTPDAQLNPRDVLTEFSRQQAQLQSLLERAQHIDIGKLRIPISIASWIKLSLGDTFRFLIAHEQRHVLQAQKVLSALSSLETANPISQ
ncbi:DinB family protein [Spirosoma endbachense]|uniref:DinB family protein n=1 Tax=Spirosoma endbachense TaxID=2666025 RepID=A0A6P1VYP2_9BACT|nr:DinB family protein [Spirosoma endbachense]QHV97744.1 DinB family protein [Spirosoma endbachense]